MDNNIDLYRPDNTSYLAFLNTRNRYRDTSQMIFYLQNTHTAFWDNSEERYERRNWMIMPEKRSRRFSGIM